jgi:cytochrome P450
MLRAFWKRLWTGAEPVLQAALALGARTDRGILDQPPRSRRPDLLSTPSRWIRFTIINIRMLPWFPTTASASRWSRRCGIIGWVGRTTGRGAQTMSTAHAFSHWDKVIYDPLSPEQNEDPYPVLEALRKTDPVHRSDPYNLWVVTRYEDVRQGINEPALFSSETPNTGQSELCPRAREVLAACPVMPPTLVTADPPVQPNNRRPVQRALAARRIRLMTPHVHDIASALLADFQSAGQVEFVSSFAGPLPVTVVAELLGVPPEMYAQFSLWADDVAMGLSAGLTEDEQVRVATSTQESESLLLSIVRDRRVQPQDDLVSELIAATRPDGTPFSDMELVSIFFLFVVAGHETTTSLLAGMLLVLAMHPEMAAELLRDEGSYDGFIEESLRYFTPVQGRYRAAMADTEIRGQAVRGGDRLQFLLSSANRDDAVFADPDVFDFRRPNARAHLSFGYGVHFCVGAELARLEAREALKLLLPAMPNLRLKPGFVPTWAKHFHLRSLTSLDLLFDPPGQMPVLPSLPAETAP